jgi:hypothetical protein
VLQRSTHEAAVDVPDIPATIQPGETVDWPTPIAGFEPTETPPDEAGAPKTTRSKKAAPAPAPVGEEPQP